MSKQYRLPDWLGGHEVNRLTDASHPGRINVTLNQGEGVILEIDLKDLTDLRPAEPPDGTHWTAGGNVYSRMDDSGDPVGRWYMTGDSAMLRWYQIAASDLRQLVEEPADAATVYGPFTVEYDDDSNRIVVKHVRVGFVAAYAPTVPVSLAVIHADIAKDREVWAKDYERNDDKDAQPAASSAQGCPCIGEGSP